MNIGFFALVIALGTTSGAQGVPAAAAEVQAGAIVPGVEIGHLRLGKDLNALKISMKGVQVHDEGVMSNTYEVWRARDGNTITLIAIISDGGLKFLVNQVRATATYFETRQGIGPGSSLLDVEAAFPNARTVRHRPKTPYAGTLALLDDPGQGIAFEFPVRNGRLSPDAKCSAVLIHTPGKGELDCFVPIYNIQPDGSLLCLGRWNPAWSKGD